MQELFSNNLKKVPTPEKRPRQLTTNAPRLLNARSLSGCGPLGRIDQLGEKNGRLTPPATTDTMTQSEGTETTGAPARDRGSGLRQCC